MNKIFMTIGWLMLFVLFVLAIAMSSCNVTRTVTTRSGSRSSSCEGPEQGHH